MGTDTFKTIIMTLDQQCYGHPVEYANQKKGYFMFESYKAWAAKEIKDYILSHPNYPIVSVLEDFRGLMDDFACRAQSADANFIFSVAYDVATDLLDGVLRK